MPVWVDGQAPLPPESTTENSSPSRLKSAITVNVTDISVKDPEIVVPEIVISAVEEFGNVQSQTP